MAETHGGTTFAGELAKVDGFFALATAFVFEEWEAADPAKLDLRALRIVDEMKG